MPTVIVVMIFTLTVLIIIPRESVKPKKEPRTYYKYEGL